MSSQRGGYVSRSGFGLLAVGFLLAVLVATFMPLTARALPNTWEWQNTSDDAWVDVENDTGVMIWGRIIDTVEYDNDLWAAGRNSGGDGILWRYDTTTGMWSNETPDNFNEDSNGSIMSLVVHDDRLYFGTSNSDAGAELWYFDGDTWTRDTGFDDADTGLMTIYDLSLQGNFLCAYGRAAFMEVFCKVSGNWISYHLSEDTNAAYQSWQSSKLVEVGSRLYIDAVTDDSYPGIWRFSSGDWTHVETPFTDEEETGEETRWNILDMAEGPNGNLTVAVSDNYGVEQVWILTEGGWTQLGLNNFGYPDDGSYDFGKLINYKGKLLVGAGSYGNPAEIHEWSGTAWILRTEAYFGVEMNNNGYNPNFVMSMSVVGDTLFAATAAEGEGAYFAQVWRTPLFEGNESEGDPEGLPNGGDLNNDGIVDAGQAHVQSFLSGVSGKYAALEVSNDCSIEEVGLRKEIDLGTQDSAYEYPNGLMRFEVGCGDPGYTATVTQYYYDLSKEGFTLRKFLPTTNAFFTISDASIQEVIIDGHTVVKAVYQVTDGGVLDVDGEANGMIVDPAGLGQALVGTPNTGFGIR